MAIAVNDSNFEEVVLKAEVPVLVDFWAEWCGPCKMMLPIVEEISKEFEGKLVVAKVNVDEGSAAAKYGIRNIPTILFFKNGEVADKQVGAVPKTTLVSKINALLKNKKPPIGGFFVCVLIKKIPGDSRCNDHQNRVHFKFESGNEGYGEDDIAFVVHEVLFVHQ